MWCVCFSQSRDYRSAARVFAPDVQHEDGGDEEETHNQHRDGAAVDTERREDGQNTDTSIATERSYDQNCCKSVNREPDLAYRFREMLQRSTERYVYGTASL